MIKIIKPGKYHNKIRFGCGECKELIQQKIGKLKEVEE